MLSPAATKTAHYECPKQQRGLHLPSLTARCAEYRPQGLSKLFATALAVYVGILTRFASSNEDCTNNTIKTIASNALFSSNEDCTIRNTLCNGEACLLQNTRDKDSQNQLAYAATKTNNTCAGETPSAIHTHARRPLHSIHRSCSSPRSA